MDVATTANMETNTENNVNEKISQQTIENTKPMKVNEILLKDINSNSNKPLSPKQVKKRPGYLNDYA